MTEIRQSRHSQWVKISVMGHAGFNPGNDPVCAAASVLTFQLLAMLEKMEESGDIGGLVSEVSDGKAIAGFRVMDENKWENVWETVRSGYEILAENYPENVRLY